MGGRILLLGAGHAHLLLLRRAAAIRRRGHALAIVAPGPFWYSGLATGVLNGERAPEEDQVDVAALAARAGAAFHRGRVAGLDRAARLVRLEDGTALPYDALSLALGSETAPLPGAEALPDRVFPVKPIANLWALRQALEARFAAGRAAKVVVAGVGITGVELAASVAGLAARRGGRARVTILAGEGPPLRGVPDSAAGPLLRSLRARGVALASGRATAVRADHVETTAGPLPFDLLAVATGLRPPPVLAELGLPLAADGALAVDARLRSPADPRVHGAGDCVAFEGHALPRAGVFAVRQAPVLRHNLLAAVEGGAPRRFRPRARYLWIMNLGDGTGFASYGPLHARGRLALRWKDWLDRRFLAGLGP
ncbi:pyridine nucleotide-disulfide oxidoreductase [Roseomonas nepalensis]|uniref:Pyridine nucleotide-disulfide oxidoreductase n=1 Tax=Muricoccus nepalensis TaxID=1854500 RepID=A0A502GJX4_9PROT|nr:FAD-dependent oxidoreductase [Roseomonas nepalensis]TPG61103.1 pyridine nucleotide-disulfide oxidoreductase [Roseomonas nepalensis]